MTKSSGNVFADLGLPNPEELLRKSELVAEIADAIKRHRLSQVKAAQLMGVSQPDLSKLLRGRTMAFSLDRIINMLTALGDDVEIRIRRGGARRGRVLVIREIAVEVEPPVERELV